MPIDPKDAPPGCVAVKRVKCVDDEGGCLEQGGCAFWDECRLLDPLDRSGAAAFDGSPPLPRIPGNVSGCRIGDRKDDCRALFKRIEYGNEED